MCLGYVQRNSFCIKYYNLQLITHLIKKFSKNEGVKLRTPCILCFFRFCSTKKSVRYPELSLISERKRHAIYNRGVCII